MPNVKDYPLKRQTKIAADDFSKEIRLEISCESSALQRIYMKLSSLILSEKQGKSFYECHDWRIMG